jgi:excisionase family DNA binding protein
MSTTTQPTSREQTVSGQIERTFLTLPEAAAEIKSSRRFIELRIEDGELACFRPSKRLTRIKRTEWERWLESYSAKRGAA